MPDRCDTLFSARTERPTEGFWTSEGLAFCFIFSPKAKKSPQTVTLFPFAEIKFELRASPIPFDLTIPVELCYVPGASARAWHSMPSKTASLPLKNSGLAEKADKATGEYNTI